MAGSNVWLIFRREVRDQLRDRRTLFTVLVLPLLLYPLLGGTFLQIAQFMREHPTKALVIGAENLPGEPPFIVDGKFADGIATESDRRSLQLELATAPAGLSLEALTARVKHQLQVGECDVVLYFPPNFGDQLSAFRVQLQFGLKSNDTDPTASELESESTIPQPVVFKNTAVDKSKIAFLRIDAILERWREQIVRDNLQESHIPAAATRPFQVQQTDVATVSRIKAAVWSKVLPLVLLVWALTGAFYPAIDICAGEKERGTLETLLCSPALRSEIVWGKLLTVMTFSMATALLNLASMGFTGMFIARQLGQMHGVAMDSQFGPPSLASIGWLLLALPPMSALFSALALAIAAFARSSKEGQYYLMPLLMIMLPLMTLPMLPAAHLDLGVSLIPVTGLMLLLRNLMEGQHSDALRYALPVVFVTGVCCLMAIRWAIDQFNRESVLFRESEQWGLGLWLRHIMRDRGDTPSFADAMLCAVLLLVIKFFASFLSAMPESFAGLRTLIVVSQLAFIAAPALFMAIMLTRRPLLSLLVKRPSFLATIPAAMLLAAMLHPSMMIVSQVIQQLYPIHPDTLKLLKPLDTLLRSASLPQALLLMALVPAICEELAFRGFILSGLRHIGHKWTAIVLTAAFFGAVHGILQQSIGAFVIGIVIGYIAVKTGSIFPAIAYHFVHNGLSLITQRLTPETLRESLTLQLMLEPASEGGNAYVLSYTIISALLAVAILFWFKSLPYEATCEEALEEVRDRQSPLLAVKLAR